MGAELDTLRTLASVAGGTAAAAVPLVPDS